MIGIAPVGRAKYIHASNVATIIGLGLSALRSRLSNSYVSSPPRKIDQVCAHITREAVLQTWVPKAVPTAINAAGVMLRTSRAVLKTTMVKPAISNAANNR